MCASHVVRLAHMAVTTVRRPDWVTFPAFRPDGRMEGKRGVC
jgi:hypothetical protein